MSDKIVLAVEERKVIGKKVRQLRKEGMVPAVVYGHDVEAKSVMAPAPIAEKVWKTAGKHHVIELTIGSGAKRLAMIKSADLDPVKRRVRHLSLHVVKQNEKVETEVPVHITGEGGTEAEKAGLVVLKTIEKVQIEALPKDLPDFLQIDGAKLAAAEDHVTVADIMPVAGVTVTSDPDQTVATVYEPSALAAQNDAAAGDGMLPSDVAADNGADVPEPEAEASTEAEPKAEK